MNNKFQNIKNKTVVYDELDDYEERDYQDNIEEILIVENEIEEAEKIQKKLSSIISTEREKIKIANELKVTIIAIEVIGTIVLIAAIIYIDLTFLAVLSLNTLKRTLKMLLEWNGIMLAMGEVFGYLKKLEKGKSAKKNIKGYEIQFAFLLNYIMKKQEQLEFLKSNKSTENIEDKKPFKQQVHYKEPLKKLKEYLKICKILGIKYADKDEISVSNIQRDVKLMDYREEDITYCVNMTFNKKDTIQRNKVKKNE